MIHRRRRVAPLSGRVSRRFPTSRSKQLTPTRVGSYDRAMDNTPNTNTKTDEYGTRVTVSLGDRVIGWAYACRNSRKWEVYYLPVNADRAECVGITTKRDALEWLTDKAATLAGVAR